jgi:hypothetical protein
VVEAEMEVPEDAEDAKREDAEVTLLPQGLSRRV